MTKQEFEYHVSQIILDARSIGHYRGRRILDVKDIIDSHERSIQFHREKLNAFYDRNEETE